MSTIVQAASVTVEVRGWATIGAKGNLEHHWCPRNWSNYRPDRWAKAAEIKAWRERTRVAAQQARVRAGWPLPERTDPPRPRYLELTIWKYHQWPFDPDGALSAMKPLIDGLEGVLLVKDSSKWVVPITPLDKLQQLTKAVNLQRVVFTVHLHDPREAP